MNLCNPKSSRRLAAFVAAGNMSRFNWWMRACGVFLLWATTAITLPAQTFTTLHSFDGTDGAAPYAGLVQATDGNLYGTTTYYGANDVGTVFKIPTSGTLTTLHSFDNTDGASPYAGLVQANDGNLYGTAKAGGANGYGTVFKITTSGTLTTLHSFDNTDGTSPYAGLVQATDGNLYGTTYLGGANGYGTLFKITTSGTLTTLHSFCPLYGCPDGASLYAGLVQATNGDFYGTTTNGGSDFGTVFSLSMGLKAFLEIQSTSGKEGAKVGILGQGFSSSSVVKFGGTKATTIVLSGTTYITATVPAGALTGSVTVTTGSTTLTSTKTFKVLPTITSFTPSSGPVGTSVTITGTGLDQTTKVTFDGKPAPFTVIKATEGTADVPTGAVTGKIVVAPKGGSATSATSFTVN